MVAGITHLKKSWQPMSSCNQPLFMPDEIISKTNMRGKPSAG